MCGIAALLRISGPPVDADVIEAMTQAVSHRGPDGCGTALFGLDSRGVREIAPGRPTQWQVALGHRRLSILDLSDAGRQPMAYRDRLWLTYNGEIYNYVELRAQLEQLGHQFHSHTDSEVILAAYDEWGTDCFRRFRGMWGLVLIDARRRMAVLSRDRLGIKPLYLARVGGLIAIASEIKQFLSVPGVRMQPDESVVRDYVQTGYEQQGHTFFEQITPLAPGTWQTVDLASGETSPAESYWFPERVDVDIHDPDEAASLFREALLQSVRIHLRSDVPVGCALSGGLDSSSIAACIARLNSGSEHPLETFTVTFPGSAIDEQYFAEQVVKTVGSSAHYVTPTPRQFLEDLDRFLWIHDEPVGSLAQYAGYALARLTREAGVPVTLNGQGGDEVLAGYWQSYFMHLRGLLRSGRLWRLSRHFAGAMFSHGNPELPRQVPIMLRRYRARRKASALSNGGAQLAGRDSAEVKLSRMMTMSEEQRRVYEIRHMFLPRLLKWDDRNFMAFAVEGRYPFLDHEMIELALRFAPSALYSKGWTKEPLRRGLAGMLPQTVLRRRTKFGFETPQDEWLCGPLRGALEDWLKSDSPVWQYIDRSDAQALAQQVWQLEGARDEPGQVLMRLYLTDRWLKLFFTPAVAT